jgi:hypothetical protein
MKERLTNETKQEAETQQEQTGQQRREAALEFDSVEEMIRYDAAQTTVSPELGERLLRSVETERPPRPWWKRWLPDPTR